MSEEDPLADVVPLTVAAKAVGIPLWLVREIAVKRGIAIRWGGSEHCPRLRVKLSKLREAIMDHVYRNADKPVSIRRRHQPAAPLHPDVRC